MEFAVGRVQFLIGLIFGLRGFRGFRLRQPKPWARKACALIFPVLCALSGASPLLAQAPVPSATETPAGTTGTNDSASQTGVADPRLDARVESLLQSMTLEEKIGQLVQYSAGQATGPGTGRTDYKDMIAKEQIGCLNPGVW